jgi:hypothetical protein
MRIVCFLDYNDLYAFNFENGLIPLQQEREPIETREAFRLIRLQLWVTGVRMPELEERYWSLGSNVGTKEGREMLRKAEEGDGEVDWRKWPIVSFEGMSKSTYMSWDPNANSRIRGESFHLRFIPPPGGFALMLILPGTARMTPHGNVHWTTFSIFHGEERWRSEGIQIGGVKSARGILGNWFDKDFDVHGPAGPTAFWKVSDDREVEKPVNAIGGPGLWSLGGAFVGATGGLVGFHVGVLGQGGGGAGGDQGEEDDDDD